MEAFAWLGERHPYIDVPHTTTYGPITLGCYGGTSSAGAAKNEDGAWVLCATDGSWELAVLLDAHVTSQSARLMVQWCEETQHELKQICQSPSQQAITNLSLFLITAFSSPSFRESARLVQGETACLIVFRTAKWLYWLSIGDCVVYLLHPDLMRLGQYALNQRQFYEWIGQANTFDQLVPCYVSGVRELRNGEHIVVMLTDGVLECGTRPFDNPETLARFLMPNAPEVPLERRIHAVLEQVKAEMGRDSATLLAWRCTNDSQQVTEPSQIST